MPRRNYDQFCALARALDVVGERWTLLIVRELFAGPQRFSDLLQTLPGIGNGLLATRLREMQELNLIELGELPPPAASRVYQLTSHGRQLDEAMTALARWGSSLLPQIDTRDPDLHKQPIWLLQSLAARTRKSDLNAHKLDVNVQLDGQQLHLRFRSGRLIAGRGPYPHAQATITATGEFLYAFSTNQCSLEDCLSNKQIQIYGDEEAAHRVLRCLALSE